MSLQEGLKGGHGLQRGGLRTAVGLVCVLWLVIHSEGRGPSCRHLLASGEGLVLLQPPAEGRGDVWMTQNRRAASPPGPALEGSSV